MARTGFSFADNILAQGGMSAGTFMSGPPAGYVSAQDKLAQSLIQAQGAANAANEARYAQLMKEYDAFNNWTSKKINTLGVQAKKDINQNWLGTVSQGQQDLVGSGLYGSTVLPSMRMGAERMRSADLTRLNDSLTREKLGYKTALFNGKMGVIQNRNDVVPDVYGMMQGAM